VPGPSTTLSLSSTAFAATHEVEAGRYIGCEKFEQLGGIGHSDLLLGNAHRIFVTGPGSFVRSDQCVGWARKLLLKLTALGLIVAPPVTGFSQRPAFPDGVRF